MKQERQIDILYRKYEYLAGIYARKVFNLDAISYDKEDILQDFRTKLFTTIVNYVKQFKKFRDGHRRRPIMIEPYLRLSMSNLVVDFIKKMNQSKHNGWNHYLSIERDGFDYSSGSNITGNFDSIVNFKISEFKEDEIIELNGIDILQGLENRKDKMAFVMFLKGYKMKTIDQVLKIKSGKVIRPQIERLKEHEEQLLDIQKYSMTVYNSTEDVS